MAPINPDELDYDNDVADYPIRQDDGAITRHGFDSRATPIDVLMAGPVQMHLDLADDMMFGDDA